MTDNTRNVSDHYAGDKGQVYTAYHQSDPSHIGYQLNYDYFQPYIKASDVVLDFGCGNGGMLRLLSEEVAEAHGIEVNPHSRSIATALGLTVFADLDELPQDRSYDVVTSNHVFEHVRDVASTLEQIRSRMNPGALLILKLPLDDFRAADQKSWSRTDIDHHLQTWTPKLLGNVLYESGFEVEDIRVITSAWHPRLFFLTRFGLGKAAFWAMSVLKKRRQLFAVARVPADDS